MSQNDWYHLDNVAKVFLATHNKRDTRSMRVCCTLKEEIDPEILQQALDKTIQLRPQLQVRIRRGFFWHYMEPTQHKPVVKEESERPCPILYGKDYKGKLHYEVTYYGNRINLDIFHALTDGSGALQVLNILVLNYLNIKYPDKLTDAIVQNGADADSLVQNSFKQFYERKGFIKTSGSSSVNAYHIRSKKLPYNQLQFMEIHMSASEILKRSKELGVSMTSYLGTVLMFSIHKDMPSLSKKLPITISMPVNLRNFFPSDTSRNFFNSVSVSHVFSPDDTFEIVAKEYDEKLKGNLTKEKIEKQMQEYEKIEHLFVTRVVPLFLKQPVVRYFAKKQSKTVSAVLSNLGIMKLPEEMQQYVDAYSMFCATSELFITISSYQDDLVLGVASAYSGTGVLKNIARWLQKDGLEVTVAANNVVR